MATLEEAKICPRCSEPGRLSHEHKFRSGKKVITFMCDNERCRWYSTGWLVQVNPDGTIPERVAGAKQFEKLDRNASSYAEAVLNKTKQELMKGEVDTPELG